MVPLGCSVGQESADVRTHHSQVTPTTEVNNVTSGQVGRVPCSVEYATHNIHNVYLSLLYIGRPRDLSIHACPTDTRVIRVYNKTHDLYIPCTYVCTHNMHICTYVQLGYVPFRSDFGLSM